MASPALLNFEKTKDGLKKLDNHLRDFSFISGYQPSQEDVKVFKTLGSPNDLSVNALRWYNNIASYTPAEQSKFPGDKPVETKKEAPKAAAPAAAAKPADDDDLDLFDSDEEEDAQAAAIREQRIKDYAAKKSKKPAVIAKSSVVLDVKPWDDETNMADIEKAVRSIYIDGLVWGASKLVPVGYGINKLQIMCIVEDDKVSVDLLTESIVEFEDLVQSIDIAAFNKI